jgi:hypothetical protein
MPAKVQKRKGKYRVVEPGGKLVKNNSGTPVDGGGHSSKEAAQRQAAAVNSDN